MGWSAISAASQPSSSSRGERESTIALLARSCPRLAPAPLKHLAEWLAWRTHAHPPNSARIERAKNVSLLDDLLGA
jgi:hypothetical protein